MSEALVSTVTRYTVLSEAAGLRLILLVEDEVAFIEIPSDIAFHIEDLHDLIEIAEEFNFTQPPYGLLIEDAWLFDDEFDDRVVLIRRYPGEAE